MKKLKIVDCPVLFGRKEIEEKLVEIEKDSTNRKENLYNIRSKRK